ncbi:hypothetical protein CYMTET_50033 [Cymbomonas tetramitiformis]|uniref:Uncharacterized protein n=1 Tax=Cymbomonas tetramitiformis TaxID=36881 RepID=A0AAE0ETJ5_9CHLO|nr:hypothetical protein CYMTET_50033 [Cymbomonas tetramitiformis]
MADNRIGEDLSFTRGSRSRCDTRVVAKPGEGQEAKLAELFNSEKRIELAQLVTTANERTGVHYTLNERFSLNTVRNVQQHNKYAQCIRMWKARGLEKEIEDRQQKRRLHEEAFATSEAQRQSSEHRSSRRKRRRDNRFSDDDEATRSDRSNLRDERRPIAPKGHPERWHPEDDTDLKPSRISRERESQAHTRALLHSLDARSSGGLPHSSPGDSPQTSNSEEIEGIARPPSVLGDSEDEEQSATMQQFLSSRTKRGRGAVGFQADKPESDNESQLSGSSSTSLSSSSDDEARRRQRRKLKKQRKEEKKKKHKRHKEKRGKEKNARKSK